MEPEEGVPVMKRIGSQWQVLALAAGLVISVQASAQEEDIVGDRSNARNFGKVGQIVINSAFVGPSFSLVSSGGPGGALGYESDSEAFFISLNPSADYFLQENLSVGAAMGLATT